MGLNFQHSRLLSDDEVGWARVISQIQFLKQGPAYKKEGPNPNKGSNQQ